MRGQRHNYFLSKMVYCSGSGFQLLLACVVYAVCQDSTVLRKR